MIPENCIYTYSGVSFSPLSPCEEDICAQDIAHALSYMCRANGHFSGFYSVAQHCLSCEREAHARGYSERVRLACLLHDASEAFISDITRPVKRQLTEYREIEKRLQAVIYRRFGLDPEDAELLRAVAEIDDAMLYHEFLALGGLALFDTAPEIKTQPDYSFVAFEQTEKQFLKTLDMLYKG
ncbi:MAG: phosphohydrolase [Oscillospiraceae bacterium]|nr:phosphohydrolase [Oscillospiraceae bacterium]